jgi:3-hydroxyacyl-CoA dehydrogenase
MPTKIRFDSVGKHRKIEDTGARIKTLINESDRAGQFVWHIHAALFAYASLKLGEITDTVVDIDNANRWGFNHELGPFQIWDAVGVGKTLPRLAADGYTCAAWVQEMVDTGHPTFYQRNAKGVVVGYYDPAHKTYVPMQVNKDFIVIENLRAEGKEVDRLPGASLLDMGDGVALLEFHSKANSIDDDIVKMAHKALKRLQTDFDGMVIGNQGENFSVGANIFMLLMIANNEDWQQMHQVIKAGQDLTQALRYAPKPIVTAPFGLVLGGGSELTMSGVRSVAHTETYIGLVEFGVGVIPAWGGCKEMLRRNLNPVMESSPNADPMPHIQKVFEQIAMAKVAESAAQGKQMGFFTNADRFVTNRDELLAEAKREVLHLIPNYEPRNAGKIYAAGRDVRAALETGAWMLKESGYATDYEVHMAQKLAYILTGGVSEPQWVDEQVILDLEREVFVELCHNEKTRHRLQHMLEQNKPLRN